MFDSHRKKTNMKFELTEEKTMLSNQMAVQHRFKILFAEKEGEKPRLYFTQFVTPDEEKLRPDFEKMLKYKRRSAYHKILDAILDGENVI